MAYFSCHFWLQNAGDIAFVVHIHDKDYVRADMLPMRRTFHPNALIKIPRDKTKVEEGIEFLKGIYKLVAVS